MTKSKNSKKLSLIKNKKNKKVLFVMFFVVTLFLLTVPFLAFNFYYSQKIYPGVKIAGIDVSNKTKSETQLLLETGVEVPEKINLIAKDQYFELSLEGIAFSYDFDKTINKAYLANREGNLFSNLIGIIKTNRQNVNFGLKVSLDEAKLGEYLQVTSSQVTTEPELPSVKYEKGNIIVNKGVPGEFVDINSFKKTLTEKLSFRDYSDIIVPFVTDDSSLTDTEAELLEIRAENLLGKTIALQNEFDTFILNENETFSFLSKGDGFDENKISTYVKEEIEPVVNREPQNAVFQFESGKVAEFKPAKNGLTVNSQLLKDEIINGLMLLETNTDKTANLKIPVQAKTPEITTDKVNDLGIKELIGRGTSSFRGSIPGRIYNVGLASSKFNGVLIPPGEIASFNNIVGDVSSLTGYKSAYIIKDGRTVLGDGGGVCQVSTTLFRAALNAGLPIVERRAHSYRVSYYEQDSGPGLDATVYSPTTDLKFRNDTPGHILIQTIYDAKKLTLAFEIYGTSDGRVATITKPVITSTSAPPEDLYVDDPTLPAGTIKQIDYKAWGAKSQFDYKVERNGEVLIDKTFYSNYRPWQAVFLRGTGPTQ